MAVSTTGDTTGNTTVTGTGRVSQFLQMLRAKIDAGIAYYELETGMPYSLTGGAAKRGRPVGSGRRATEPGAAEETPGAPAAAGGAAGDNIELVLGIVAANPGINRKGIESRLPAGSRLNAGRLQQVLNNRVEDGTLSVIGAGNNRVYSATGKPWAKPTTAKAA